MPIYEFLCGCGHRFEKLCKIDEGAAFSCPQCGGEGRRVMSAFRTGRSSSFDGGGDIGGSSGCSSCSSSSCATCG